MSFSRITARVVVLCCALFGATNQAEAFSTLKPSVASKSDVAQQHQHQPSSSRRDWIGNVGGMAALVATTVAVGFPEGASAAADDYLTELKTDLSKLQPIPQLLQDEKWDEVRTILKTAPVNNLWNLGDSQNTVLKLIKETGNVELVEMKDDLAYNLQMCDQFAYANNFIAFQPGNGKLKIKEPIEAINGALGKLETIIKEAN